MNFCDISEFDVWPSWDPEVDMTMISGQGTSSSLQLGNWFSFELDIDVPSTASDEQLKIEISTNPLNDEATAEPGRTAAVISNSSVLAIGNHLEGVLFENTNDYLDVGGNQVDEIFL